MEDYHPNAENLNRKNLTKENYHTLSPLMQLEWD
jgi:hypothetical protein